MTGKTPGEERTEVRIITGFLGSGKTTLVNYILSEEHGLGRVGVIENEYGEVGIDGMLLAQKTFEDGAVVEVSNGCLCCTVRGDLKRAVVEMLEKEPRVESIFVETSGVADPGPVIQTFLGDDEIAQRCVLKGVITVVDAMHLEEHLGKDKQVGGQIASADLILLNKCDLVSNTAIQRTETLLKSMNTAKNIIKCVKSRIDLRLLLQTEWFEKDVPSITDSAPSHPHGISVVTVQSPGSMNLGAVELFLSKVTTAQGDDLYRYKGVLPIKGHEDERYIFQGVHQIYGGEIVPGGWPPNTPKAAHMVFIGRNLNKEDLQAGLDSCLAADTLRFNVNDQVECSTPVGWQKGRVLETWCNGNPYLIEILSGIPNIPGRKLYSPVDSDVYVRSV